VSRPKTGFNPPMDNMVDALGPEAILGELNYLSNLFDMDFIDKIVRDHFAGRQNNTFKLWQLLYFSRWVRCNKPLPVDAG
jgi:asparagine synthase (glutamine-hydrolysing)